MAFKRLLGKSVLLSLREKKIFIVFTLIYTVLIFLTSLFIDLATKGNLGLIANYFVIIFFSTSLFLSLLYAWIIVSRNRRVWATLKCIGYTNRNINVIISGIILFTTIMGFIINIEVLLHYAAILSYAKSYDSTLNYPVILIGLEPIILTSILFIVVQILAIYLANRKVLKVRPIIALKKVGE
ncbi:MAG: FtsX-like permease family protein [Promethearchaeota archaeon]